MAPQMRKVTLEPANGLDLYQFLQEVSNLTTPLTSLFKKVDKDTATLALGDDLVLTVDFKPDKKFANSIVERAVLSQDGQSIFSETNWGQPLWFLQNLAKTGGAADVVNDGLLGAVHQLFGTKGSDTLCGDQAAGWFGRAGNDVLVASANVAEDSFDGETGSDTVDYGRFYAPLSVTVNLADSSKNAGMALGDVFRSVKNVIGTNLDDSLTGNDRNNILAGGAGADTLDGRAGEDFASYSGSETGIILNLADMTQNTGDAAGDQFIGIEGVIGTSQMDTLIGDTDDNIIRGGLGDDVIDGAGGDDELWGDSDAAGVDGADTFVFSGPDTGAKYIMDFDVFDHIQISRTGYGLHPLYKISERTTLIIADKEPTALTNSPTFLVEKSTGDLYFDADGSGAGEAEFIANIEFDSQKYLDANDFVILG